MKCCYNISDFGLALPASFESDINDVLFTSSIMTLYSDYTAKMLPIAIS